MVAQATCSAARQCWLRAWERAKTEKLIPFRTDAAHWTVKSYTVTITGAGWSDLICSCPVGRNGRICKHAAVVAKAIAVGVSPIMGTEQGKEVAPSTAAEMAASAAIRQEIGREVTAGTGIWADAAPAPAPAPFVLTPSVLIPPRAGLVDPLSEVFA